MDSMRRNAQKMMPHVMALNKKPTMGMKNDRQPAPAVSKLVAYAKGGKVMAKGGAADKKQDKSMLARHNRLMHPGQKSKLKNGGMVSKYADGGNVTAQKFEKERDEPVKSLRDDPDDRKSANSEIDKIAKKSPSTFGGPKDDPTNFRAREKAQEDINVIRRRMQDKYPNEDWYGYNGKRVVKGKPVLKAKGGRVKSKAKGDKKKVMGTVGEAKAVMAALQKARRPATPMPGTRMAGLGMAPPMAPQMAPPMKRGGKVMKKAAGGAAKLRRKSPMPDKIKMVNYPRGG
jgi:hypothetical protein